MEPSDWNQSILFMNGEKKLKVLEENVESFRVKLNPFINNTKILNFKSFKL